MTRDNYSSNILGDVEKKKFIFFSIEELETTLLIPKKGNFVDLIPISLTILVFRPKLAKKIKMTPFFSRDCHVNSKILGLRQEC